jgi:hypothetical protein
MLLLLAIQKGIQKSMQTSPHSTMLRLGVTWAQGHCCQCTLVGVLPHMAPPCLVGLQCRHVMVFLSSMAEPVGSPGGPGTTPNFR